MTFAKSNIGDMKSGPSNRFFLEFTPTSFGKESNKTVFNKTEIYWMSKTIYEDKFKIATKLIFFHLIYCSFESIEHGITERFGVKVTISTRVISYHVLVNNVLFY